MASPHKNLSLPRTALLFDQVLRTWPQVRALFDRQQQVTETEVQAFFERHVPGVTAAWPAIRQQLLHSQLLHLAAPTLLAHGAGPVRSRFRPAPAAGWPELWQLLQAHLSLPLGCLWTTQWLHAVLPQLPSCVVVEVHWAEVPWATRVLARSPGNPFAAVVVRPWYRRSPVQRSQGLPLARAEKILVDVGEIPEFAGGIPETELAAAVFAWHQQHPLDLPCLLRYATHYQAQERWGTLLAALAILPASKS